VWLACSWDYVIHRVGRPLCAGEESGEDNTITVCDSLRTCPLHTYWRSSGVSMRMSKAGQHTCTYSCACSRRPALAGPQSVWSIELSWPVSLTTAQAVT